MKTFKIVGFSKALDGTVAGSMLWNWREGKWVAREGDDGAGTSMTIETVSVKPINADKLRAFAEDQLERAQADSGYLENITLRENEIEKEEE